MAIRFSTKGKSDLKLILCYSLLSNKPKQVGPFHSSFAGEEERKLSLKLFHTRSHLGAQCVWAVQMFLEKARRGRREQAKSSGRPRFHGNGRCFQIVFTGILKESDSPLDLLQKEFVMPPPLLFRKLSNPDLSPAATAATKSKLHRQLSQDESWARRSSMAMTGKQLLPLSCSLHTGVSQLAWQGGPGAPGGETNNLVRMRSQSLGQSAPSLTGLTLSVKCTCLGLGDLIIHHAQQPPGTRLHIVVLLLTCHDYSARSSGGKRSQVEPGRPYHIDRVAHSHQQAAATTTVCISRPLSRSTEPLGLRDLSSVVVMREGHVKGRLDAGGVTALTSRRTSRSSADERLDASGGASRDEMESVMQSEAWRGGEQGRDGQHE
ncbi:Microtubule-associated serine/threonine-protein kinase 2 [Liparis tanakae]|uniref:Microtubule-associated serine/threonine-protein kinase 2 n=1 Tax=Liparis tanakae TaxID=230148 RepID=A0A4Z2IAF1_9TELE|nr:Microtubule-associated serine/threonine-protein kinase 2 [Liparis tanakae]